MNTHSLGVRDIVNLALQRTSSLRTFPVFGKGRISPSYYLWAKFGNDFLLQLEAKLRKKQIVEIAAHEIKDELSQILTTIATKEIKSVASIGPGLGMEIVELANVLSVSKVLLIDIEDNNRFHHGFNEQGAGYNNLSVTRDFINRNISRAIDFTLINPEIDNQIKNHDAKYDLIISLISCGFHYPAKTYLDFFQKNLSDNGCIVLDLRKGEDHKELLKLFDAKLIVETGKYERVICTKKK